MTIRLEEGKYYRARDGRVYGPIILNAPGSIATYPCTANGYSWTLDGRYHSGYPSHPDDLIAEVSAPIAASTFYMVVGPDGPPRLRHKDLASATAERDRLAKKELGKTFYVLKAISSACAEIAPLRVETLG